MAQDNYLSRRAEQELLMARRASSPAAKRAHYELAGLLFDALYNPEWVWPGTKAETGMEGDCHSYIIAADWLVRMPVVQ